jgi:hypothetical protein
MKFVTTLAGLALALGGIILAQDQPTTFRPRYTVVNSMHPIDPLAYKDLGPGGKALPIWGAFFMYNNQPYGFYMIGTDPSAGSATSKIKLVIIPVAVTFSNGKVLDPTRPVQCRGTDSALTLTEQSPLLTNVDWNQGGTDVGTTQYLDGFQRAEWWNFANGNSPGYHVLLNPVISKPAIINVPASQGKTVGGRGCGIYGDVEGLYFDAQIRDIIVKRHLQPNELPFFLSYDVVEDHGILGYHSTLSNTIYATATFNDQNLGPKHAFQDMVPMSHVLGATFNDPFGTNLTPNWKSSFAPQQGCENLLEVGDPLNGLAEPVKLAGKKHQYYVQDLAFELWFAKAATSSSVNGWFSMYGTFKDSSSNENCK